MENLKRIMWLDDIYECPIEGCRTHKTVRSAILDIINNGVPDILFLDYQLENEEGTDLLMQCKIKNIIIPNIVYMSSEKKYNVIIADYVTEYMLDSRLFVFNKVYGSRDSMLHLCEKILNIKITENA